MNESKPHLLLITTWLTAFKKSTHSVDIHRHIYGFITDIKPRSRGKFFKEFHHPSIKLRNQVKHVVIVVYSAWVLGAFACNWHQIILESLLYKLDLAVYFRFSFKIHCYWNKGKLPGSNVAFHSMTQFCKIIV